MKRLFMEFLPAWLLMTSALSAVPAGSLQINANPGTTYGNRAFTNVVWGGGYPLASLQFNTDTSVVFAAVHGGGPAQRIANNTIDPGTLNNDNPAFTGVYTNRLRLNALIADTGTVTATYTFSSPMTLIDFILCDFDDDDRAVISATGPGDAPIAPSNFIFLAEGDLSLTNNAGGRPALEPATPPAWNSTTGVLVAQVPWNENRSYTILRAPEGLAIKTFTIAFTGARADSDGPTNSGLGSHIYVNLWASPRPERIEATTTSWIWRLPTLPGLAHTVETSTDLTTWTVVHTLTGAAAPVAHATWTNAGTAPLEFLRFRRLLP